MTDIGQLIKQSSLVPLQRLILLLLVPYTEAGSVVSQQVLRDESGLAKGALIKHLIRLRKAGIVNANYVKHGKAMSYTIDPTKIPPKPPKKKAS